MADKIASGNGRLTIKFLSINFEPSNRSTNVSIKFSQKSNLLITWKIAKNSFKDQKIVQDLEVPSKSLIFKFDCVTSKVGKDEVSLGTHDIHIEDKESREFEWSIQIDKESKQKSPRQNPTLPSALQNGNVPLFLKLRIQYQYVGPAQRNSSSIFQRSKTPNFPSFQTVKSPKGKRDKDKGQDKEKPRRITQGRGGLPDHLSKLMETKNIDGLREFLRSASKEEVNMPIDDQGNTLLHTACIDCPSLPLAILDTLLQCPHTDVTVKNKAANTPLHYLCAHWQSPDLRVFETFLQRGADVKAVNTAGESPLFKAITNRTVRKPIIKTLLTAGADPNQVNSYNEGILHYVARQGNGDILKLILTKCQNASLKRKGREGLTPTEIANAEEKKNKERSQDYHRIYKTLSGVEELDDFLQEHNLMEHRSFFIEEGIDLQELCSWNEAELDNLPLRIGPKSKLTRGLIEYKQKMQREPHKRGSNAMDLDATLMALDCTRINDEEKIEEVRQALIQMSKTTGQDVVFVLISQLEFLDELGRGASGSVWRGILRKDGFGEERGIEVAIKRLITASEDFLDEFKKEFMVLHSVNHPNVIKLFGVALKPHLILVMEYCAKGSMHHVISSSKKIGWDYFFRICKQVVSGLQALHNHSPKILHRDLKPLNLLITADDQVKVADFGLSLDTNARSDVLREQRGTSAYMPPELLRDKGEKYTTKSDIYSLGIIFWEMLYRVINSKHQRPFAEFPNSSGPKSELMIIFSVAQGLRPTIPANSPPDLARLVQVCISAEPETRPECADILQLLERVETDYLSDKETWDARIVNV